MSEDRVTVVGTVENGAYSVCDLSIIAGSDDYPRHVRDSEFFIVTNDGRRVLVAGALAAEGLEKRTVSGPWSEISQHPTQPIGNYHPDGHVKLKGRWVIPGDRVCAIGRATDFAFVEDTGGQREAPQRAPSRVIAEAIALGDDAETAAQKALVRLEKEREKNRKALSRPAVPAQFLPTAVFVAAGVVIAIEVITREGLLGVGISVAFIGLLAMWSFAKLQPFPGGAAHSDPENDTTPGALSAFTAGMIIPLAIVMMLFADSPPKRNAVGAAPLLLLGLLPIWKAWYGVIVKPHAEPGDQVYLPASKATRWVLLVGMIALVALAAIIAIPEFDGDGAM